MDILTNVKDNVIDNSDNDNEDDNGSDANNSCNIFKEEKWAVLQLFCLDRTASASKLELFELSRKWTTVFSLLNALGVYIFLLILGWASIGEGR